MQQTFICSGPAFCVWAFRASSWAFCLGPFSRLCGARRGLISSARPPLFLRLLPPRRQSYKCVSPLKTKVDALNGLHHCKISRNSEDERYLVLLSDCLLFCHFYGSLNFMSDRFLTVKYNIPILQIRVSDSNDETFPTEFSITSKVRGFTVRAKYIFLQ